MFALLLPLTPPPNDLALQRWNLDVGARHR